MKNLILSLDLGTTGNRAMIVNSEGNILASAYCALDLVCPKPGWVEQDAVQIWEAAKDVIGRVLQQVPAGAVQTIGLLVLLWFLLLLLCFVKKSMVFPPQHLLD